MKRCSPFASLMRYPSATIGPAAACPPVFLCFHCGSNTRDCFPVLSGLQFYGWSMFGVTMRVEIKNEAQRCAAEIRKVCPDARVIAFGSSIDDNVRNPRDIDLLVVLPQQVDFKTLRSDILAIPRTTWPLDIIVVPDDFLAEKLKASSNFYAFACSEGIEFGTE